MFIQIQVADPKNEHTGNTKWTQWAEIIYLFVYNSLIHIYVTTMIKE